MRITTAKVLQDVAAERKRQDVLWGGPEHDDEHESWEWRDFRAKYEERVRNYLESPHEGVYEFADGRAALVKIAALAVAQIEAMDRSVQPATPEPR